MKCRHCDKPIGMLRRMVDTEFCSPACQKMAKEQEESLALERLLGATQPAMVPPVLEDFSIELPDAAMLLDASGPLDSEPLAAVGHGSLTTMGSGTLELPVFTDGLIASQGYPAAGLDLADLPLPDLGDLLHPDSLPLPDDVTDERPSPGLLLIPELPAEMASATAAEPHWSMVRPPAEETVELPSLQELGVATAGFPVAVQEPDSPREAQFLPEPMYGQPVVTAVRNGVLPALPEPVPAWSRLTSRTEPAALIGQLSGPVAAGLLPVVVHPSPSFRLGNRKRAAEPLPLTTALLHPELRQQPEGALLPPAATAEWADWQLEPAARLRQQDTPPYPPRTERHLPSALFTVLPADPEPAAPEEATAVVAEREAAELPLPAEEIPSMADLLTQLALPEPPTEVTVLANQDVLLVPETETLTEALFASAAAPLAPIAAEQPEPAAPGLLALPDAAPAAPALVAPGHGCATPLPLRAVLPRMAAVAPRQPRLARPDWNSSGYSLAGAPAFVLTPRRPQ